jgi:hypothetical protein
MAGSTLSATLTSEITLGSGNYLSPLTIARTGIINAPAPTTSLQSASAIYLGTGISGATLINHGSVNGRLPQFDTLSVPALLAKSPLDIVNYGTIIGQSGIYLDDGGTITNSGLIAGADTRSQHDYGVWLVNGSLINSGTVYGAKYGVTNWNMSEIENSGAILGSLAAVDIISTSFAYHGTLINTGTVYGRQTGITATQGLITNSGTVTGERYGIRISWGSTISNTGTITGGLDGVLLLNQQYQTSQDSSLTNAGSIAGGYFGVALNFSDVSNLATGSITGQTFGVGVGEAGYFLNAGSVYGVDAGLLTENGGLAVNAGRIKGATIGAYLFSDSNFTNASSGYVNGATGIRDQGGYLLNAGSILGASFGVYLESGGIAVNSGTITASGEGIYLSSNSATSSPDFLVNSGTVYGKAAGVVVKNGTVYNLGKISGGPIGVSLAAATSLNNAGSIYGQKYGVQLPAASVTNSGTITGKKTGVEISHGYLLNSGTISGGTYAIYGQDFTLAVDAGAAFSGQVLDKTDTSTLDLTGLAFGTLAGLGTTINAFDTIDFISGAHWLLSGNSAGLAHHQVINGFTFGDTIMLTGFSTSNIVFLADAEIELASGTSFLYLTIAVTTTADYHITATSLGTEITFQIPCFAAGTRILTDRGKIPVQDLSVGETVITSAAEGRPIIWIGKRTIDLRHHPDPKTVQPIRIAANALAENVPDRDLVVSPDHAIYIDGYLIPAKELLNHSNITQDGPDRITYYHIELDEHAVIFAENAAVETYLDTGNRSCFAEGGAAIIPPQDLGNAARQQRSCAVLLESGNVLSDIRARILRTAAQDAEAGLFQSQGRQV